MLSIRLARERSPPARGGPGSRTRSDPPREVRVACLLLSGKTLFTHHG